MNCKPGQLARIISTPENDRYGFTNLVIRVTNEVPVYKTVFGLIIDSEPGWEYEGEPFERTCRDPGCPCGNTNIFIIDAFADRVLRPLDDPDDDAVDEMVKIVGPADLEKVHG